MKRIAHKKVNPSKLLFLCWGIMMPVLLCSQVDLNLSYQLNFHIDEAGKNADGQFSISLVNTTEKPWEYISFQVYANAFRDQTSFLAQELLDLNYDQFYNNPDKYKSSCRYFNVSDGKDSLRIVFSKDGGDIARAYFTKAIEPGQSLKLTGLYGISIPDHITEFNSLKNYIIFKHFYPSVCGHDGNRWLEYPNSFTTPPGLPFSDFELELTLPDSFTMPTGNNSYTKHNLRIDGLDGKPNKYRLIQRTKEVACIIYKGKDNQSLPYEYQTINLNSNQSVFISYVLPSTDEKLPKHILESTESFIKNQFDLLGFYPYKHHTIVFSDVNYATYSPNLTFWPQTLLESTLDSTKRNIPVESMIYDHFVVDYAKEPILLNAFELFIAYRLNSETDLPDRIESKLGNLKNLANKGYDQPFGLEYSAYSKVGRHLNTYQKMFSQLELLKGFVGEELFFKTAGNLISTAKGQKTLTFHEVISFYENATGKDLSWLDDDIIGKNIQPDFVLKSIKNVDSDSSKITIQNKSDLNSPILFRSIGATGFYENVLNGVNGTQDMMTSAKNCGDQTMVNFAIIPFDRSFHNNIIGKKSTLSFGIDSRNDYNFKAGSTLVLLPLVGYNLYDRFMLGLNINNGIKNQKPFKFSIAPFYAFGSKTITGSAFLDYEFYLTGRKISRIDAGLRGRSYHLNDFANDKMRFAMVNPYVSVHFRNNQRSNVLSSLSLKEYWVSEQKPDFASDSTQAYIGKETIQQNVHALEFYREKLSKVNPNKLLVRLQNQFYSFLDEPGKYLRLDLDYSVNLHYDESKFLTIRAKAGYFIFNSSRYISSYNNELARGSLSLFNRGQEDQLYEQVFAGRTEQSGFFSQQSSGVNLFHNTISTSYPYGSSNSYMAGISLKGKLPMFPQFIPLKIYFDAGVLPVYQYISEDNYELDRHDIEYIFGAAIEHDRIGGIYFPIFSSKNIKSVYKESGYLNAISFRLNLESYELIRLSKSRRDESLMKL